MRKSNFRHPEFVKTRFCPSPTGLLHLGNVRTALFNDLFAKNQQGVFLLRIEDTDKERSEERFTKCLQEDLLWLGLVWQEGPGCESTDGPYYQSQRQSIYDDYYHRLEVMGLAYPCFCSQQELALARKIQQASGRPPRYPGTCRDLSFTDVEQKIEAGIKPTLRFRIPEERTVTFVDGVKGEQHFACKDMGDFIIRRADGTAPFMYCNAIDDALMGVTHVLRGEDHLTNTPRQILILEALSLTIPQYAHIALIVAASGEPLSKRLGSRSIVELREEGYLPLAVVNYLARLGHYYGHDRLQTLQELALEFRMEHLSKSPAHFNPEQLNFWQKTALDSLDSDKLWEWVGEDVASVVPPAKRLLFLDAVRNNIRFPADALAWAKIIFTQQPLLLTADDFSGVDSAYFGECLKAYAIHCNHIVAILDHLKLHLQLKGKALFQPIRLALTGQQHGPELPKIVALMEPGVVGERLQAALELVSA